MLFGVTLKRKGGRPDWVFYEDAQGNVKYVSDRGTVYRLHLCTHGIQVNRISFESGRCPPSETARPALLLFPGGGRYEFRFSGECDVSMVTLKRRRGPDMIFELDENDDGLTYLSSHCTWYRLELTVDGIRVMRYSMKYHGYIDATKSVKADRLLFPGGGEYKFGRRR